MTPTPPPPASSSSEGVTFHPAGARFLPISGRLASSAWPPSLFNMKLLNHFPIETFISSIKLQAVVLWSSADCCGSVCMSGMVCRPQQSHYVINKTNKGFFFFFFNSFCSHTSYQRLGSSGTASPPLIPPRSCKGDSSSIGYSAGLYIHQPGKKKKRKSIDVTCLIWRNFSRTCSHSFLVLCRLFLW